MILLLLCFFLFFFRLNCPPLFFFKIYFVTIYSKRFLYFHTIFLNPNCFQRDIGVNFCCRALFQLDMITCLISAGAKRAIDYDVPHASSISDDQVYPCCGLLELEKWNVCHHSCADVIRHFRQQLLKSETAFCNVCHKNCTSPADFVLHQEHVHLCLPLFACPVWHFTYITHSCL